MAADLQPSHNHNIPVLLNLDNSITVSLETFPAILTKQMNFGASDSKEKNLSLEDLCKAANSDLLASKSKGKDTKSGFSASSNIQMQSKNSITGFIANVGLTVNEDILSESKQSQISLKDKQSDKYKCEYCGKICAKPSILQKHIRAHTNERPFPCEECGVQFKTKSNLHKHCKSRSHLIHSAQISIQKDAGDKNVEKISSPTFVSSNNNKCDIQENTSSSWDGQDDSNTKPQSSVFFLNQFGNGQVIFKPLGHVGEINVASLNSSNTVRSVSQKILSECSPDSNISQASSQRPFLKSFSEKGQPKTVHHVKPHSHSFSNEMDLNQIPKLDKTMTSDDIQKRISMIITLNDHIIDTPKEIKNHRFRKFVRDSDYGNASMDSCSGRLVTRSNSITPTLGSDSFLGFTLTSSSVGSKSPTIHNSNFLAAPTNEHIWPFVTNKSSSDSRSTLSTQKIQHFSLPETGSHDANEFRNFTKAHSFGSSQSVLVSRSDSSLRALSVSSDPHVLKFFSRIPLEIISKNACDYDHAHLSSQSTDINPSLSPAVSPSSSPIHSSDHRLKLKRGRPKGSKNKLKSPVCSATCAQPIVPTIHITSPEDNPPESNCRKELKRLLLMKRSMSNENSSDKNQLVPVPITSTYQASQTTAVSSTLTSCTGIKHLSPSSIPIKKRRKTLTELGRGTAFGTKVDDHNLELGASSKAKNNITKPLWSSDSSFCKSTLLDDIRAQESLENLQRNVTITANKSDPKISENTALIDLTETNSKLQICLVDTSAHFSCSPKDLASNLSKISNSEANSSFVTFANEPPQTCDSSLLPLDLLKERYVLIPTHFINQAVALDDNENKAMECSLKTSASHLSSSSLNHKVGFNSVAATNNVHEVTDIKNVICLDDRYLNMSATESSTQQEMNCNTENKLKHTTNIMHLKFKGCSHLRQTSKIKPMASSSELLDHCTSNLSIELSKRARVDASLSSNDSLDDCLLRAQMDSEAAASLLDLSKSRHPPSLQDEISMEMSVSHANTISLNELPRSTIASVLQTSEKARHDDHFFSSAGSVIKNYNFVEGKHVCPICQKTFPKEHSLSLHKNVHYMEKPYRCGKCQATFQSNWLLKRHQNIVHHLSKSLYDPRPFKCLECKVAFRTRGHLAKHARSKVHSEKIKSKSAKCISDENDEDGRESYDCIETSSGTHMPSFTPAIIQDSFVHNSSMNSGTSKTSSQAVSNLYNCDGHQDQFQGQVSSPDSTLHKLKQSIEPRSLTLNDLAINEAMLEFHTDENSISQISEAKPKKLSFIGKSRCCDTEQMGTETIFNHTGPTGDLDDVSKSLSQKYLKLQDYQTSLITSNSDASSVKEDAMMFPCCVCSTACEDPLSLLNHYESHLEQRVHICLICDAGFKTQESLNGHLNLHCEKHSMGIQTQENEILGEFLRKCDSSLKIPMMASPHPQDSLRVLPYLGNPANCLSTVGGGKTFLQLPQSNVSSIVPCLSQKCIMSSGQWALQQSNLHLPANPIQQVTKLQHLEPEVKNDTFPKLSQLITDEGFPATHPASHLLLQPVSISNNISLFPQNTYLLVPSEASKGDTSPNHGEVLFFDPSAGCFFAASGRSLIGSATPVTKSLSSLAIPVESHNSIKPV